MRERRDHPVRESKCAIRLHAAEIHSTPDGQFARFDEHPLRRLRERAAHAVLLHHAACRVARTRVVAVRRQHDAVRQMPRRVRFTVHPYLSAVGEEGMLTVDVALVLQVEELGAAQLGARVVLEPVGLHRVARERPVAHRVASADDAVGEVVVGGVAVEMSV